jgi:hypothetical protein
MRYFAAPVPDTIEQPILIDSVYSIYGMRA